MAFEANANSERKSGWVKYINPVKWVRDSFRFIVESKNEMKRITWPDKSKILRSTSVVLTAVLLITGFTWLVDSVFNLCLNYFLQLVR